MKKLILISILFLGSCHYVHAQADDKITISREAAVTALKNADTVTALEAEMKTLLQAIEDQKKLITDLKIELAKQTGELTGQQQMVVRLAAMLEFALQNTKKKRNALVTIF